MPLFLVEFTRFGECAINVGLVQSMCLFIRLYFYKNTPESYKLATEIGRQDKEHVTRRGVEIAAAVALKQRDPGLALELLTAIDFSNNLLTRNLKVGILNIYN